MLRTERLRDEATKVAGRASSTFFAVVGIAALAVAVVAAMPAEAKKRQNSAKPIEEPIPDIANGEPMTLVVSLSNQKVDVYRGTTLITSSAVSTGMPGHATKMGVFSILEKQRYHHSNIYSGAPMPWMNRITWSGTALHAGVVPGYPASHGCIRLPFSFAPKLFQITTAGDNVIVSRDRLAPQLIEHPNLFQPLPPPPLPVMVKQEQPPQRQSSNEILPVPAAQPGHPGMLARADLAGSTTDVPSSLEAEAAGQEAAPALKADAAAVEDTHVHAFDPFAGAAAQAGMQNGHAAPTESAAGASGHALDDDGGPSSGSGTVSAASVDRAPVEAPEPVPAKAELSATVAPQAEPASAETSARATAPAEPASVIAKTPPAEPANVAVEAAPAPATAVPAAVQAVAATPQASMAEANAKVDAGPPSIIATKLGAGTKAAGIMAAEPRSTAPLRILVTRRTQRDRIIGVQQILAELGYLPQLDFDGTPREAHRNCHQGLPKGQLDA